MKCPTCGKAMEYFGGTRTPLGSKAYVCHDCKIKTTNCNVQHIGFFETPMVSLSGVASSEEFNALVERIEKAIFK